MAMEKVIKFKVWDDNNKIMYPVAYFTISTPTGKWFLVSGVSKGKVYAIKEAILLQYIGIKDKNGVEIYDGYIVKDERGKAYEVFSVPGGFAVNAFGGRNDNNFWDGLSDMQNGGWLKQTEVIGDKYQNPELLES